MTRKIKRCLNCHSDRRNVLSKGYCKKCYRYVQLIQQSKKWEHNKLPTLKSFPRTGIRLDLITFEKIKKNVPKQWEKRLEWLKFREYQLQNTITGINLEYAFQNIAKMCGVRNKNLFFGIASSLDLTFSLEQMKAIFRLIDQIEQDIRWKGINWNEVFLED